MNVTVPKVHKGRKFDQVLSGARTVFMADGFEGASVDEIARVAAVSKATLYSYFPDKRLLFMEVANAECARQAQEALDSAGTVKAAVLMLASVTLALSSAIVCTYRVPGDAGG